LHCITFRTESARNKNKAGKDPAKKKSPKKKNKENDLEEMQTQASSQVRAKRGRKKN